MNKKSTQTPSSYGSVKAWLAGSCCWFTILCMALLLLNATVWQTNGIPPLRFIFLFPLALCASAARMVRRSRLTKGARYALHPLLTVGGIYIFGLLPYQIQSNARAITMLIMVLLVLIAYGISVGIGALILRKKKTTATEQEGYQSLFGERNR